MRGLILCCILIILLLDNSDCWRRRRRRRRAPPVIHGGWSALVLSGKCSKTCGVGIQYKRRTCTNPRPQNGGRQCAGPASFSVQCNIHSCPQPPPLYTGGGIKYQRVGCYLETVRVLRELVITERDPGSSAWNGNWIDWSNWNSYMVGFLNRCAAKVKSKGYKVFAASSYGECWSERGVTNALAKYSGNSRVDSMCVKENYNNCIDVDARCVGKDAGSAVFKIIN
ncbi:semaphorin-5B-like [Rhopilema esculentum]|uniref:semaphorin-5B-like n=1 Tax=Rhopilema esculentum TaxID=499914 RepID=UPI0031DC1510